MRKKKKEKQQILAKKVLTIIIIAIMMVNLVLLAAGKINPLLFWIIIAVCAIIAFKAFPTKKKNEIIKIH